MAEIVVSGRAYSDFKRIWRYIAEDSERAADQLLLAMDDRIQALAAFPEMGPTRPEIAPDARVLIHGGYLILYTFDPARDLVEIVAIVEGMRDLDRLL